MKSKSIYTHFDSRKCIWKCRQGIARQSFCLGVNMLIKRGPGGINQISDTHSTSLTLNASSIMSVCIITKFYIFVHMAVCSLYPFTSGMRSLVEYRIRYVELVFIWKVNMMIQCHKGHLHTTGVGLPTWAPLVNLSARETYVLIGYIRWNTLIYAQFHRRQAAAIPVKYECEMKECFGDTQQQRRHRLSTTLDMIHVHVWYNL